MWSLAQTSIVLTTALSSVRASDSNLEQTVAGRSLQLTSPPTPPLAPADDCGWGCEMCYGLGVATSVVIVLLCCCCVLSYQWWRGAYFGWGPSKSWDYQQRKQEQFGVSTTAVSTTAVSPPTVYASGLMPAPLPLSPISYSQSVYSSRDPRFRSPRPDRDARTSDIHI